VAAKKKYFAKLNFFLLLFFDYCETWAEVVPFQVMSVEFITGLLHLEVTCHDSNAECNLDFFTKAFNYISLEVPAHFGRNKIFSFSYHTVKQRSCPQKHQRAFSDQLCVPGRRPKCKSILFDLLQDQTPGASQVKEVISEVLVVYNRKLLHLSVILVSPKYNVTNTGLVLA